MIIFEIYENLKSQLYKFWTHLEIFKTKFTNIGLVLSSLS